ncbi:glycoside hydrolase superfamily [Pseudomassariella vexata]|uniref:Glycoside hydrolase superfamily n=1 Tax=Pseudomassariella vexata TaxID=1141098 RepID=A0A1Y2DXB1_9PEZI|nr:glycoside hydrolase superfamily [Pseudomassariella vexata]ORY63932.1 glycoside hydrolase superfamily [Pseudomassariella vexata]
MQVHFQEDGRTIILRGVNLADGKFPPERETRRPDSLDEADTCSFVDTPFPLSSAPQHLARLRYLGFNVLRLPVVWEALEHAGPGIYDERYISHVVSLVKLCNKHGFKVLINPHQDLWSRHSGGSGAPLWTLHACGLNPDHFADTHANVRYCEWPVDSPQKDPKAIPAMMWTTNHNRLATSTIFALFFGGRDFAPRCVIDGVNIQDYLQQHYFAAYSHLSERLGDLPFGYDSMNEPEPGYIGWADLHKNERENAAKIGSTPSPIQSMRLGMGQTQTVNNFRLGQMGPHKTGEITLRPKGTCWLKMEDPRWKWERAESWPLDNCVWALHGVWDVETGELKKPEYFASLPDTSEAVTSVENDSEGQLSFISSYWQEYHRKWKETLRQHSNKTIIFIQPSVFSSPPPTEDPLTAYSPHFYDGLTVMRRHWHERWNADVVGILRGNYKAKMFGLRVGKSAAKSVLSRQLGELEQDLKVPTLIGEIGIPFNMDDSKAYKDGDYTSQVKAMDALLRGCDEHLLSYALWDYSVLNSHEWGDEWNGEDLSIFSAETGSFPNHPMLAGFRGAAGWCRPHVYSLTGRPLSMRFEYKTSKFSVEIESHAETEGYALIYVPWLHYRRSDDGEELDLDIRILEGDWSLTGQELRWNYRKGGKLELERGGGALTPQQLGTVVGYIVGK